MPTRPQHGTTKPEAEAKAMMDPPAHVAAPWPGVPWDNQAKSPTVQGVVLGPGPFGGWL